MFSTALHTGFRTLTRKIPAPRRRTPPTRHCARRARRPLQLECLEGRLVMANDVYGIGDAAGTGKAGAMNKSFGGASALVAQMPEIAISYGSLDILDGTLTPLSVGTAVRGQLGPSVIITVRNLGTASLQLTSPQIPAGFTLVEPLVASLSPGASDSFTIRLVTTTAGVRSGPVSINNSDADENPFDFYITGTVIEAGAPEIDVQYAGQSLIDNSSSPVINFGSVNQGELPPQLTFTVRNLGTGRLSLSGTQLPAGFSLAEGLDPYLDPIDGDPLTKDTDTFTVRLDSNTVGLKAGRIWISNNDADENPFDFPVSGNVVAAALPTVSVEATRPATAERNQPPGEFTFRRTGSTVGDLIVDFSVSGSATPAADYQAIGQSVVIPSGASAKVVSVIPFDDTLIEPTEDVVVTIAARPANYQIDAAYSRATVTIDDDEVGVSIGDVSVVEGNSGTTLAQFPVMLNRPSNVPLTVNYATADGSATVANADYQPRSGQLTIPANTLGATISVPVIGDIVVEPDEQFYVNLSGVSGNLSARLADSQGVGTIINDDRAALSINDVTVIEGDSGYRDATFTVRLDMPLSAPLSVDYATRDGSAMVADNDYLGTSGTLSFASGETSKSITVKVVGDLKDEWDEEFFVGLSLVDGRVQLIDGEGVGTIIDDDPKDGKDFERILHQGQETCECVVMSDGMAIQTKDAGFTKELSYEGAELPAYYADGTFNPDANIANFKLKLPESAAVPQQLSVEVSVNGTVLGQALHSVAGFAPGSSVAFAVSLNMGVPMEGAQSMQIRVAGLVNGQVIGRRQLNDTLLVINRTQSLFGERWWLPSLDRLVPSAGGAAWLTGRNLAWWFSLQVGSYQTPDGLFSTLTKISDGFVLRDKFGDSEQFDSQGLLQARVDRLGNRTSYTYTDADADGQVDDLASITDPRGHVTSYLYAGGRLERVRDFAGRDTLFLVDPANRLTSVVYPDPDGSQGPLSSPQYGFSYDASGRLSRVTDAEGRTTTFGYDPQTGRFSTSAKADGSVWSIVPSQAIGWNQVVAANQLYATFTDGNGNQTKVRHDNFGNAIERISAMGTIETWERNRHGLVLVNTQPDPDGPGARVAPVTAYSYDSRGNVLVQTLPDGSERRWQYDSQFSQVTRATDELGRMTTWAIDSGNGNILSMTQHVREVTILQPTRGGDAAHPWQNPVDRYDVNGDGFITAMDSKLVLDELNATGARALPVPPPAVGGPPPYLDVSGDNYLTAADVLIVMNALNGYVEQFTTRYSYSSGGVLPAGLPLTVSDALGRATSFAYGIDRLAPGFGLIKSVTAADGSQRSYEYDAADNVTAVVDELGRRRTARYDRLDRLVETVDEDPDAGGPGLARVTTYDYDRVSNIREIRDLERGGMGDQLLRRTSTTYDSLNRVAIQFEPRADGATVAPNTQFTYDANGNVTRVRDVLGSLTQYQYDSLNRRVLVTQPSTADHAAPLTVFVYDALGNVTELRDPRNNVTQYRYDARQRVIELLEPAPDAAAPAVRPVTRYTYDAAGQLLAATDPLGRRTEYMYDDRGLLLQVTLPQVGAMSRTIWAYDAIGNRRFQLDAANQVTGYEYDSQDRLVRQMSPDPDGPLGGLSSPVTTYGYDLAGQLVLIVDPLRRESKYEFDRVGRVTKSLEPDPDRQINGADGSLTADWTAFTYDTLGNLMSSTDSLQQVTRYRYDAVGNMIARTDPRLGETRVTYNAAGSPISLIDPVGNRTDWAYDSLGRATHEITYDTDPANPNGIVTRMRRYSYDAVGNLVRFTDRNGRVIEYGYDNLDRRRSEIWKAGAANVRTITFGYDLADQLVSASDPAASLFYVYDAQGRVSRVTQQLAGVGLPQSIAMDSAYDVRSNRTSVSATIAGTADFVTNYRYDGLSRVTQITQAGRAGGNSVQSKRVDLAYDAVGAWTTISRFADLAGTRLVAASGFTQDRAGRLTELTHTGPLTQLAKYQWTYDTAGQLISVESSSDGRVDYAYDASGQLVSETYRNAALSGYSRQYSFDANGNRNMTGHTTGRNNRIASDGQFDYQYDAEGNRTRRTRRSDGAVTEYTWDYRNRLTGVTEKSALGTVLRRSNYNYDAFDRRVAKEFDPDGSGPQTAWREFDVYDGEHVSLVFRDADAAGPAIPVLSSRLLYGAAVDQILAQEQINSLVGAGEVWWSLADQLGTVRDVVNSRGELANHLTYDAFGKVIRETNNAVDVLFGFTGRDRDEETGLSYFRARYYDSSAGSFISEDPIGYAARDTNLQRYVGNTPTGAIDPSGLVEWWEEDGTWAGAGYNPFSWFGVRSFVNWGTGYSRANAEGRTIERKARTEARQRAINELDPEAFRATYRLGQCERAAMKAYAEAAIEYNAAALGGGFLKPGGQSGKLGSGASAARAAEGKLDDVAVQAGKSAAHGIPPATLQQFKGGGAWLMTEAQYYTYIHGRKMIGRADGQFMVPSIEMNRVIAETAGDPVKLGKALGVPTWDAHSVLVRVDVVDPTRFNPRMPDASLSGANSMFKPGGITVGGVPEIVTDRLPASEVWMTHVPRTR